MNFSIYKALFSGSLVRKCAMVCFALAVATTGASAQSTTSSSENKDVVAKATPVRRITGTVKDDKGQPVIGASVVSKTNNRRGASTNVDGTFAFNIEVDATHIVVSMIGMQTKEVAISQRNESIDVVLVADVVEVDNVVVTGYVSKAKNSFTGTATQVTGEQLIMVNPTNVLEGLQAFDPSFVISDMDGLYGSNPNYVPSSIEIRGANSLPDISEGTLQTYTSLPIFIIDGFQVDVEQVYNLDVNRVESVTILKDAAASSIYGSRASNGVIVIVTKMPEKGKVQVSYTFNGSIETPDLSSYNLMNAQEIVDYYDKMNVFDTSDPEMANMMELLRMEAANGVDTYWLSQPLQSAFQQSHSLFLDGGIDVGEKKTNSLRYSVNLSANLQDGVMKGSDRNVYGGGTKLIFDTKKLQVTSDIQVSMTDYTNSPYGSFSTYTQLLPNYRITDEDGNYLPTLSLANIPMYDNYTWGSSLSSTLGYQINPLYEATELANYSGGNSLNATYSFGANWEVIDDLRIKANFSASHSTSTTEDYVSPFSSTVDDGLGSSLDELYRKGSYSRTDNSSNTYYGMVNISYLKTLGKHTIQAVVGGELNESNGYTDSYSVVGFLNDYMTDVSSSTQYTVNGSPSGSNSIVRTSGAFATANYSYDNRYMLDYSYRLDGSSNFASKQRVSGFWALGARWNLSEESFMQNQDIFSNLAFKANIGTTGNSNFSLSQILSMYQYLEMYDGVTGAELLSLANPNLKWQTTLKKNVGVELGLWNNRLNVEFNVYSNRTEDNVTTISILPSTGFSTYMANQGDVINDGYEFFVSVTPVQTKDFQFNFFINGSHNRNTLEKLSDALQAYNDAVIAGQNDIETGATKVENVFLFEEGGSLTSIYAVRSLGIDPGTGQEIFLTKDGERTFDWNAADQVVVGDTQADIYGYFGFNFNYRRWQLSSTFQYSYGGQIYNSTLVDRIENPSLNLSSGATAYNMDKRALYDRWAEPGDVAKYSGAGSSSVTYTSSRFVQDNNYLSMSSLKLMYTLNKPNTKLWGFSMLKVALSTNDLFYLSTVEQERGLYYPYARTYYLTLQANF